MPVLAALLLLIPVPQDQVFTRDGRTLQGEVVRASLTEVVLKDADDKEVTLAGGDVIRIRHENAPESLTRAREFLASGDYQNAVAGFQAAESGEGPSWVPIEAPLERAEALLAWSQIDPDRAQEALALFNEWLASHPDHFLVVRARVGQARALSRTGQVEEAAAKLEELGTFAFEKNLGKRVELRARLERSLVLLDGGKPQMAATRLRDLVPKIQDLIRSGLEPGERAEVRGFLVRARIALGDAIAAKDGPQAARPYWESLLRDPGVGPEVQAASLIGQAQAAEESGRPREAQLLLARVVATLPATPSIQARALFRLGEVCRKLKDTPFKGETYLRQVLDSYPNTLWAARARKELGQ